MINYMIMSLKQKKIKIIWTKDKIEPQHIHSVTYMYDLYIRLQTNEITEGLVVWVALNKWTPGIEKGHRLLGVLGSGRQGVNKKKCSFTYDKGK